MIGVGVSLRHLRGSVSSAALSAYAVLGLEPPLVLDFDETFYRTGGTATDLVSAATHTRAGNATMVDSDGLLKWAPHNFLKYSEDFRNTADAGETRPWAYANATIDPNGLLAPDNSLSADKLTDDAVSGPHLVRTVNFPETNRRGVAVFAKAGTISFLQVLYSNTSSAGAYATVIFDLSTGSVSQQDVGASATIFGTPTISSVGDGWFLCTFDAQVNAISSVILAIAPAASGNSFGPTGYISYSGSGDSIYLWGAHLYRSDLGGMVNNPATGDSYVPTTDAARYLPRVGHHIWNGSAWVDEGYFHESEARTNLIENSQDFDAGSYVGIASIVVPSYADSPIGSNTATRLIDDNAGGVGTVGWADASTIVSVSTTYTFWAILKKDQLSWAYLETRAFTTPGNVQTYFDLENGIVGTVGTGHTAHMKGFGNGWYLCGITFTTDVADTSGQPRVYASSANATSSVDRDGTSSILMAAWQFEAGSTPSSYTPTAGATVTRAADAMTIPAANLPWNPLAVSIQMEGTMTYADEGTAVTAVPFSWYNSSINLIETSVSTFSSDNGKLSFKQNSNGVGDNVQSGLTVYPAGINVPFNIASRHGSTFINGAIDGTALTANLTPTALPYLENTDMQIGSTFNGTIKLVRVWADDLTDEGIEEASA